MYLCVSMYTQVYEHLYYAVCATERYYLTEGYHPIIMGPTTWELQIN